MLILGLKGLRGGIRKTCKSFLSQGTKQTVHNTKLPVLSRV